MREPKGSLSFCMVMALSLLKASRMPRTLSDRSFTSGSIIFMTTSSASVSIVFVVLLATGRYDDYNQSVVRTFTDRNAAQNYIARKNDAIAEARGLQSALDRLLTEWEKVNPAPPSRYDGGSGEWSEEKEEAHRIARCEEENRLSHILGLDAEWEALKLNSYDGRYACYMYVESKLDGDSYED